MKKIVRFMTFSLCMAAMVMAASCSRDDNDGDGNGGGNTDMEFGNYTFGNYHPTKHISRITCEGDRYNNFTYTYDFVWEGNNLTKIISHDVEDATYEFSYFDNGFVREIKKGNRTMHVRYSKNTVEVQRGYYDGIYADYHVYEFDNNGIPTHIGEPEYSMIDRNIYGWYDHVEAQYEQYDSHPNPFKNIIFPPNFGIGTNSSYHSNMWHTLSMQISIFSKNNRWEDCYYGIEITEYEDLDGDGEGDRNNNAAYPTQFYNNDEYITIEYAN